MLNTDFVPEDMDRRVQLAGCGRCGGPTVRLAADERSCLSCGACLYDPDETPNETEVWPRPRVKGERR